jgi:hypothetical protein
MSPRCGPAPLLRHTFAVGVRLLEASLLAGLARVGTEVVGAFEESVKEHPLIAMDTPDPYQPRSAP